KAAAAYEQAAEGRPPAEQAQRLRRSADGYLLAKDHARAVAVLERVVALDAAPEFLAEAWFTLAGAHTALKQTEQAYQAYYKCLNYPPGAVTHKARFQLALAEKGKKNFDQAESILRQNLALTSSTGDREAHEQSLYELAKLLLQRGQYDKAA